MSDNLPLVSILMTAYNRSKYIAEAIESILASTYTNFELIIVDDNSMDNTVEIAQQYANKDSRVRVYRNANNLGDYHNRNKAASYARGKYLKYLDSDDVIYPHGISVMVNCMELYPDAGFGLSQNAFPNRLHPIRLDPEEAYRINFFTGDIFGRAPGSAIIKTQAFKDCGGFTGLRQVGDYELWLKLSQCYPMVTMPRDLVWDRTHGEQEQFYDSIADKEIMHSNVAHSALDSKDCPLTSEEKIKAKNRLHRELIISFWKILVANRQVKSALSYRKKLRLSWFDVFAVLINSKKIIRI